MTYRRLIIAVIIFLAATYMKCFLPTLTQTAVPALREALDGEEVALPLTAEAVSWLDWN